MPEPAIREETRGRSNSRPGSLGEPCLPSAHPPFCWGGRGEAHPWVREATFPGPSGRSTFHGPSQPTFCTHRYLKAGTSKQDLHPWDAWLAPQTPLLHHLGNGLHLTGFLAPFCFIYPFNRHFLGAPPAWACRGAAGIQQKRLACGAYVPVAANRPAALPGPTEGRLEQTYMSQSGEGGNPTLLPGEQAVSADETGQVCYRREWGLGSPREHSPVHGRQLLRSSQWLPWGNGSPVVISSGFPREWRNLDDFFIGMS